MPVTNYERYGRQQSQKGYKSDCLLLPSNQFCYMVRKRGHLHKLWKSNLTDVTLECYGWPLMSHGNNAYPTYNYMVYYHQYPPKYNKEECGSLGIVSDTMMKSPTSLSCGSQRMDMQTGEGKNWQHVDNLLQDTGLKTLSERQTVMMDRGCWKGCVFNAGRPERRPRWGEVKLQFIECGYFNPYLLNV